MKRSVKITLTGPHVADWIGEHVSTVGGTNVATTGPLTGHSSYESRAEWTLPIAEEDDNKPSWGLLAQAIRTFMDQVPGSRELLDKHVSALRIDVTGGPR